MAIYFRDFPYKVNKKPVIKNVVTLILNTRSRFSLLKRLFVQRIRAIKKDIPKHSYYQRMNFWYDRHRDSVGNVECSGCNKDLLVTGILTLYESNTINTLESLMDKMEWWTVHNYYNEDNEYCNSSDDYDTSWCSDEDLHICPECTERLFKNKKFTRSYHKSGEKSEKGEVVVNEETEWYIVWRYL